VVPFVDRLSALSGLAGSIVIAVGIVLSDASGTGLDPNPTAPSSLIAEALVDSREKARMGAQLLMLGSFLVLWFVTYLYSCLSKVGGSTRWDSAIVFGGGVVVVTLMLIESGFYLAASEIKDYAGDTQVAKMCTAPLKLDTKSPFFS
jgi:hypothetical protein